jgi:hypothetical protein
MPEWLPVELLDALTQNLKNQLVVIYPNQSLNDIVNHPSYSPHEVALIYATFKYLSVNNQSSFVITNLQKFSDKYDNLISQNGEAIFYTISKKTTDSFVDDATIESED